MTKRQALRLAHIVLDGLPRAKLIDDVYTCASCNATMGIDDGLEPTAVCHPCAQDIAQKLAAYVIENAKRRERR